MRSWIGENGQEVRRGTIWLTRKGVGRLGEQDGMRLGRAGKIQQEQKDWVHATIKDERGEVIVHRIIGEERWARTEY
jgi:hypothetical protein